MYFDIEEGANLNYDFSPLKALPDNIIGEVEQLMYSEPPKLALPTAKSLNRKRAPPIYSPMGPLKEVGSKGAVPSL